MARLLIFLACARAGAAGIMDALDIKAVCEVPADGPRKIYLDIDRRAGERPGLLARHPVPRVLARPDADSHPRVLRVQLSTPDPGHHACP